jgi:hypothetical protein
MGTIGIFRGVPRLEVPSIWPEALAVLVPALAQSGLRGRFTPDDFLSRLTDERMQLWVFEIGGDVAAACITEVFDYPRAKALRIIAVAGEGYQLWPHWFSDVRRWAKAIGCRFMESSGRDGWARVMKDSGLEKIGVMYAAEI